MLATLEKGRTGLILMMRYTTYCNGLYHFSRQFPLVATLQLLVATLQLLVATLRLGFALLATFLLLGVVAQVEPRSTKTRYQNCGGSWMLYRATSM